MAPNNTAPPTGTVTFLFTDIEGSTALYENHPYQMRDARKRHDEILRSSIESHRGYVFNTVGDEFCAAFTTATEAIQAALSAQRALFSEEWPENATIRVRMGLHTGVAEESEGDYFGPPVNRVARLISTGHGGQVLLSDATYNLVRDALVHMEPVAELNYLGEHRLKDLRFTERIFQLIVPDLPKEFEPLRTRGLVTPAEIVNLDRRYRRIRFVGAGGFGNVYLVHHEALDRNMALKVLGRQYAEDEQFVERFKREAKSAASLNHPNIVQVYDAGEGIFEGQKVSYIAMEYVPGGTLEDLIAQQGGPLPPRAATELTLQVTKALEAAHRGGVIHRDIKPQNILLTESGEAKVTDFGIARATTSSAKLTRTGAMLGTLHYLAPELAHGKPASARSDLYALGVVLYQMLTGELPFDAETPAAIMIKHVTEPPSPPKEVNPDIPERLNAVVMHLLAKEPEKRYPDADAVTGELNRILRFLETGGGVAVAESPAPEHSQEDRETVVGDDEETLRDRPVPSSEHTLEEEASAGSTVLDETGDATVPSPPSTTVRIPDLTGKSTSLSSSTLAEEDLKLGDKREVTSETVPKGKIIRQSPEAGTEAEPGSLVSVTVSSGPERASTTEQPEQTEPQHRQRAEQARVYERQRADQARHRQQAMGTTTTVPDVGSEQQDRRRKVFGAVGAAFAGAAFVATGILVSAGSLFLWELAGIPITAMLVGLISLHVRQASSYGRLGLAGFLAAFIGSLPILVYLVLFNFAPGSLIDYELYRPDTDNASEALTPLNMLLLIGSLLGLLLVIVGLVLLGVATLRARVMPRWCGVVLMIGWLVAFVIPGGVGWMVYGLFWLTIGYTLLARRSTSLDY